MKTVARVLLLAAGGSACHGASGVPSANPALTAVETTHGAELEIRDRFHEMSRELQFDHEPEVADGRILAIEPGGPFGRIDLGRRDRLARGTCFRVLSSDDRRFKAIAEVTRVEARTAEVVFREQADPSEAPTVGDAIDNPLYTPLR